MFKLEVLSKEDVDAIHSTALKILETVGVAIQAKEALGLLANAGANIDYKEKRARMPSSLVQECLRRAPQTVNLYARNPKFDVRVERGRVCFWGAGTNIWIIDIETGKRRLATRQDSFDVTRLVDALENIGQVNGALTPQDIPPEVAARYVHSVMLKNSSKPLWFPIDSRDSVEWDIRMTSAVVGDEDELRRRPIISFGTVCSSPLMFEEEHTRGLLEAVKRGFPVDVESGCMAGATAPATLAGAIALTMAEFLAGLTMVQLVRPGAPILANLWTRIFDVRNANVSVGSPEFALLRICLGQMGQYYGIPVMTGGLSSDSKAADVQSGYEAMSAFSAAMAGCSMIGEAGTIDSNSTTDPVKLVIDNEVSGMVSTVLKGLNVDDETLALDLIKQIGPGGLFMRTKHTLKHWREQQWEARISERRNWSEWEQSSSKDTYQRAKERAKDILKTHYPDPLPEDVSKLLDGILKEAEKQSSTRH